MGQKIHWMQKLHCLPRTSDCPEKYVTYIDLPYIEKGLQKYIVYEEKFNDVVKKKYYHIIYCCHTNICPWSLLDMA